MAALKRTLLVTAGALAMTAAVLILANAGLPERAVFTGTALSGQIPTAPEINAAAPDFELPSTEGGTVRLSDLRGQPVIINFWATWCAPCQIEMPLLQTLYERYRPGGLRVLAVNLGESPALVRGWQATFGLKYDILLDESRSAAALYWLRGQPTTVLVAPTGIITHIYYGPASAAALESALQVWLEQTGAE